MPDHDDLLRQYLDLITSQHVNMPRYRATVGLSLEPHIEAQLEACRIIGLYDLDTAVGQQLDFTGQWIGLSRFLHISANIWFSFDILGLGFDTGRWKVPFEEQYNIIRLADDDYRNLLRAKILANYWDGTIPGAYRAWDQLFGATNYKLVIQDQGARAEPNVHGNMHIWQILFGPPLSQVTQLLFQGGYLGLKSAGVGTGYIIQSQPSSGFDGTNLPLFAFDTEEIPYERQSAWDEGRSTWDRSEPGGPSKWDLVTGPPSYPGNLFAGFDEGAWGQVLPPLSEYTFVEPPVQPPPPPVDQSVWDEGGSVWDVDLPGGPSKWDVP